MAEETAKVETTGTDAAESAQSASTASSGGDTTASAGVGSTVLNGAAEGADGAATASTAGANDDWRERVVKGIGEKDREAAIKKAARYTSLETFGAGAWNAMQRAAQVKDPLPADATPEQTTAWRKANGIPEKPEDYKAALPEGFIIGERDQPIVADFFAKMHAGNRDPKIAAEAVQWYYDSRAKQQQAQGEAISNFGNESVETLRSEWGGEYKGNVNAVINMLKGLPEDAAEAIKTARRADGMPLLDDVAVFKAMAQIARELDPTATLVPAGGGQKGLETELEGIRKVLREDPGKYWSDKKMQDRMAELLGAEQKIKGRAA